MGPQGQVTFPQVASVSLTVKQERFSPWSLSFLGDVCERQDHEDRGGWVARSVEPPISAQVMISRSMGSSPVSGSVLTAQSLEPTYDSVSPSLCPSPICILSLSVSLSQKQTLKHFFFKKNHEDQIRQGKGKDGPQRQDGLMDADCFCSSPIAPVS